MSVVEGIRAAVPVFVHTKEITKKSQSALHEMIKQVDIPRLKVERLYMMQCLADQLEKLPRQDASQFFIRMFPPPLAPYVDSFLGDLLAMAISLSYTCVLNSTSPLLDSATLQFPSTIEEIPGDLASTSPQLAAVILSKGYFNDKYSIFTPEIIAQWVQTLDTIDTDAFTPFDAHPLVRYSLLSPASSYLDLHPHILSAIESKRIKPLSWKIIGAISKELSNREFTLKERFLQLILVSRQVGKLTSNPPATIVNQLQRDFPGNPLVNFLLQKEK